MKKMLMFCILVCCLTAFGFQLLNANNTSKCIKICKGNDKIEFGNRTIKELDIGKIGQLKAIDYDYVLIKEKFLEEPKILDKMKEVINSGNGVLIIGNDLRETELLKNFGIDNPVTFTSDKGRFIEADEIEVNKADRLKNLKENMPESHQEEFYVIAIGFLDVDKKIPHISFVPAGLSKEQTNELIMEIISNPLSNLR